MPLNYLLPDIKLPVKSRKDEAPITKVYEHLHRINVKLLHHTPLRDLMEYIPRWGTATWSDKPHDNFSLEERKAVVNDMFEGNILPTSLETVNLVFLVSNIDLVDVTHLLRHRDFAFSAVCSADRDMRHDDAFMKPSVHFSEFAMRFVKIVEDAKQLYADMVDSENISLLDARTILPRCLEHHYYVRANLLSIPRFIKQRTDRQIQPESDNIVALKLWIEIVKAYPQLKDTINFDEPDAHYVKTAPTGRNSNIYMPEKPRNDVFEHKEQWFMYKKQRSEMLGGGVFTTLWEKLIKELEDI